MAKTLFKGTIKGTAITPARYGYGPGFWAATTLCFTISLDEKIPDVPSEFPVVSTSEYYSGIAFATSINKGDRISAKGKILRHKIDTWNVETVVMLADHILNESTKFGF